MSTKLQNNFRRFVRDESAGATVEFAIVIPILFAITFASLEFGRINMLRNTIENAAYEGARRAVVPGATVAEARAAATHILDTVNTQGATVTVTPNPLSTPSQTITVSITVPASGNGYWELDFMSGKTLTTTCTLTKEIPD